MLSEYWCWGFPQVNRPAKIQTDKQTNKQISLQGKFFLLVLRKDKGGEVVLVVRVGFPLWARQARRKHSKARDW